MDILLLILDHHHLYQCHRQCGEMNAPSAITLPNALILLVHLHILEYPRANRAEYDYDMFNTHKRGLRERSTTMEDIAYFLIGKLEGRGVKSVNTLLVGFGAVADTEAIQILATYPCRQPGESLAFRTSLAKYIEGLRHQCIFAKGDAAETAAWWWRDVVVRKSLLEECAGEKCCVQHRFIRSSNNFWQVRAPDTCAYYTHSHEIGSCSGPGPHERM